MYQLVQEDIIDKFGGKLGQADIETDIILMGTACPESFLVSYGQAVVFIIITLGDSI